MTDVENIKTSQRSSPTFADEFCELCINKDEEDQSILFELLYRVIMGENFLEETIKSEVYYEVEKKLLKKLKEEKTIGLDGTQLKKDKISFFKSIVSTKVLYEIIFSFNFQLLLKEIYKTKYKKLEACSCEHQVLAKDLISNLEMTDVPKEGQQKEKTLANIERIEKLLNQVKGLKDVIDSCHSELTNLCNHIVSKLFDAKPLLRRKETGEEESKNDGENGSSGNGIDSNGNGHDSSEEKTKSNSRQDKNVSNPNGTRSGSHTSNFNQGSSANQENSGNDGSSNENGSGNAQQSSDKSDSNQNQEHQNKKHPKKATFKSKLPKRATDILKTWFLENINNPYPTHEAKDSLGKLTGLSRKQIQNWFTNSRKRFLEPLRKKLSNNMELNIKDMNSPAGAPSIKSLSNAPKEKRIQNDIVPEQHIKPIQIQTQSLPQVQPQNYSQNNFGQQVVYQATMAPNGNYMILTPCYIQNPVIYAYKPVTNYMPVNNFMQIQPMQQVQDLSHQKHQTIQQTIPHFQQFQQSQPVQVQQFPVQNIPHMQQIQPIQPIQSVQPIQPTIQQLTPIQQLHQVQFQNQLQTMQPIPQISPVTHLQLPNNGSMQVNNGQHFMEQPYIMQVPTNMVDMTQNLSTNFNTINNNVYNSINPLGNVENENIQNNFGQENFVRVENLNQIQMNDSALAHPKQDIEPLNTQPLKHLHKADENNG